MPIGLAQSPSLLWYRTYGGTRDDEAHGIIRTTDGGYAIAGWTTNYGSNTLGWWIKTDSAGNILGSKTYGTRDFPSSNPQGKFHAIVQTSDGGYALAGCTLKTQTLGAISIQQDIPWLVRTDPDGNMLWQQTYENLTDTLFLSDIESASWIDCITLGNGGGFILGGRNKVAAVPSIFGSEFVIITDNGGAIQSYYFNYQQYWYNGINCIIPAAGGGYFASGKYQLGFGLWKFDQNGAIVGGFPKKYSVPCFDTERVEASSIAQGSDGNLLLAGHTNEWVWDWFSSGERAYPYIMRVDTSGTQISGSGKKPETHEGEINAVISTSDGGYVLAGHGKNLISGKEWSGWLLKIDSAENLQWGPQPVDFGSGEENAYSIASTTTGGYVVAGFTNSIGNGGRDVLIADFGPSLAVTIAPPSVATYVGQHVAFSSSVSGGTPTYSYQWYLDGSPVSSATSSTWTFTPASIGNYYAQLRVTDSHGTVVWSNIASVSVGIFSVAISPASVTMDVGQVQAFTSTVSGGTPPFLYKWLLDDSQVLGATSSTWSFQPSASGNYTIALQVTDSASITVSSNNASVTVNPELVVNISPTSATTTVNIPQQYSSTVTGGTPPYYYEWYANDTLVSGATSENMNFVPPEVGVYKIYLNVTDYVEVTNESNVAWLTVHKHSVANFDWSPHTPEVDELVTFNGSSSTPPDGGTIVSYAWDFGDGGLGSGEIANHVYSAVGNYTVMLNITDSEGLWDVREQQIQVLPPLSVSINPLDSSILLDQSVPFTSAVNGGVAPYSYQWYLNGSAYIGANLNSWTFSPAAVGTYSVFLAVTDSHNITKQSQSATVKVMPGLTVSISPLNASILLGQSVTFTSTVNGGTLPYSYQWYLDGSSVSPATLNSWTYTPSDTGIHYVYLKVTDAGNSTAHSETARVVVTATPVGGYSVGGYSVGGYWAPFDKQTAPKPLAVNFALVIGLALFLVSIKRKTKKEGK